MPTLLNIRLPATLENLGRWTEAVSECAREQGFDQKKTGKIELAAMNREKAFYSEKRLISAVERGKSGSVEALIQEVFRSIREFTEGEALSDDITLLALQLNGESPQGSDTT